VTTTSFHTPTPTPYPLDSVETPAEEEEEEEEYDEENTDCNANSFMEEEQESPEKRIGSNKLRGLPTPNGKSVFFLTPKDKVEQYNVHWR
jgi:hypothetical protein